VTRRVTLLTDFGTADGYVAAMKGVLATRAPGAALDDVAHDLRLGDVEGAARALARYWALYPEGTIHLVVVDPGVGTERHGLALEAWGRRVVAPDNGVVTDVLAAAEATAPSGDAPDVGALPWRAVRLQNVEPPGRPSRTFHGRDLFAPAAAHLAAGGTLEALGPELRHPVRLARPRPERDATGGARGRVVGVDRFGNLATDLPGDWLGGAASVEIAGRRVAVRGTYGDAAEGEALALVSSDGRVEIAVRNGSAARALGVGAGAAVVLWPEEAG
jgi:hypothetical protein